MAGNWIAFLVGITSLVGIYSIYVLGLNFEFGYAGLPNLGAVAYFAIGAYTSTLLTIPCPDATEMYILGFNLPMVVGVIGGGIVASFFAFLLGIPTLRLRGDYFVVVTFGFAEVLRYVLENEHWLSNGVIGFYGLPRPLRYLFSSHSYEYFFTFLIVTVLIVAYLVLNRGCNSPF
jgi:branched-chain amino acid transport system permease protein